MKVFNKNNFMIHSLGDDRYGYSNIHVTNDFTEVTNGHYLIRVYSKKKDREDLPATDKLKPLKGKVDVIIPVDSAKEIERAIPKNQHPVILNHAWFGQNTDKDTVEFICTDLNTWKPIVARKIEENYPRTEAIISNMSEDKPQTEIRFSAEYMMKLCQQFKKAEIRGVKMSIYGNDKAMKLEGKNSGEQKILAVLMPMKP